MTYTVLSGTLNSTIPYHLFNQDLLVRIDFSMYILQPSRDVWPSSGRSAVELQSNGSRTVVVTNALRVVGELVMARQRVVLWVAAGTVTVQY